MAGFCVSLLLLIVVVVVVVVVLPPMIGALLSRFLFLVFCLSVSLLLSLALAHTLSRRAYKFLCFCALSFTLSVARFLHSEQKVNAQT